MTITLPLTGCSTDTEWSIWKKFLINVDDSDLSLTAYRRITISLFSDQFSSRTDDDLHYHFTALLIKWRLLWSTSATLSDSSPTSSVNLAAVYYSLGQGPVLENHLLCHFFNKEAEVNEEYRRGK